MTEAEWLASRDPAAMLAALVDAIGPGRFDRTARLFAAGCVRTVGYSPPSALARAVVDAAELCGLGQAPASDLEAARNRWRERAAAVGMNWDELRIIDAVAWQATDAGRPYWARSASDFARRRLARRWVGPATAAASHPDHPWHTRFPAALRDADATLADLLRCVAGNPFRSTAFASEWRTAAVAGLAEAIDADRAWDRLPILADALEDAGCDNTDVLAHCRSAGPHARGCWVVEAVLQPS